MMTPNPEELNRLLAQGQYYFLPYYIEIVNQHPGGISAADAKTLVANRLLERFGIDMSDVEQTGTHVRGTSRASQWANNLISNHVLDDHMLVVRSTRATLYPGDVDNSRMLPPTSSSLTDGQVSDLDSRGPTQIDTGSGSTYRRSLQLAEHVRGLSDYACVVARPTCVAFDGRDGKPYVEVHHVIPMALQDRSEVNLDRSTNMVPLCPGCHSCLHRGRIDLAASILDELLRWFSAAHGLPFEAANADVHLDTSPAGLLGMYGAGLRLNS